MNETTPPENDRFGFEDIRQPIPKEKTDDQNVWSMFCHLSALAQFFIPFGNLAGPLILWLIKKDEMPKVDAHGKESLNFQLSMTLYFIVAGVLCFVLIGFIILPALLLAQLILVILASIKAANGEFYTYPLTLRLIK